MKKPWMIGAGIALLVIVIALAWYLGSPLVVDEVVDEPLPQPFAGDELPFDDMTNQEYEEMKEMGAVIDLNIPPLQDLREMDREEALALEGRAREQAAEKMQDSVGTEQMPVQSERVSEGEIMGVDAFHMGSGLAAMYTFPDDTRLLRFEDLDVTNGPDLRVLLTQGGDVDSAIELGKLKGNKGNQNYTVPNDVNLSTYDTVLIYCKPFHVTFAVARLR